MAGRGVGGTAVDGDACGSALRIYLRSLREARPYWPRLLAILALGLLWTPIGLLAPIPVKIVVDSVLGAAPLPPFLGALLPSTFASSPDAVLGVALVLSLLVAAIAGIHAAGDWLLREDTGARLVADFRGRLFAWSLGLPTVQHEQRCTSDTVYRISHDSPSLQWTAIYGLMPVVISGISLITMVCVIGLISPKISVIALITSVPLIFLVHASQGRLRRRWLDVMQADSDAFATIQEALGAHRIVSVFGQEEREVQRFVIRARDALVRRLRVMQIQSVIGFVQGLAVACGTAVILYLGVRDVQGEAMSVGELLMVLAYIGQLYGPIHAIGSHIVGQQGAVASAARSFALLERQPAVVERANARSISTCTGSVVFRDVSYAYPGCQPVLENISFAIPAGACVGIVGRTGAGKTTLSALLPRMFDPIRGGIFLDGIDLREYCIADLRRQFAVVPQDPVLLSGSIAENIAYSRPDATFEDIVAAAKAAHIHAFVAALPENYATRVGERGMRLSGGERQRIALARAFLRNARILILDEPTSAIDLDTEGDIVESIERLARNRTTFVVTHRLSMLRHADAIVEVAGGGARIRPACEGPLSRVW